MLLEIYESRLLYRTYIHNKVGQKYSTVAVNTIKN